MAQPKHRPAPHDEKDKEREARRAELENLQSKADGHVQKRNEFNTQARGARDERDLLNTKRKTVAEDLHKAKDERDAVNVKLREAKELRFQFQSQAKEIIATKRARLRKEAPQIRSPHLRAQELMAEINDLEFSQQTVVMSLAKENELLKQMRVRKLEYEKIKKEVDKASALKIDLSDLDKAIDELFKRAEEQHQVVLALSKESQGHHERFVKLVNEIGTITAEANKHHKRFIELKEKADAEHQAFLELRSKVLEVRGQDMADRQAAREVIREQRHRVRDAVSNPQRMAAITEDRLEQLKKGGKIQLGS